MLKLGILRSPSGKSLSTIMQTAALQYLNISGEYKSYEATSENLIKIFKELKTLGLIGFNVTIPHKINIIPLLDELTERAKLIGAVNTVTFKDGKSIGDNTDAIGFWEGIPEDIRKKIPGQNITILGCGGAACAVAISFLLNKVKSLKIYGRNKDKLENFKKILNERKEQLKLKTNIEVDLLSNINLSNTFMVVNTTPLGMSPNENESPITTNDLKKLPKDACVYDIIYMPEETKLLKEAKSLGKQTINGVEMLVRQGAASLGVWLGQDIAPLGAMRLAVLQSFGTN